MNPEPNINEQSQDVVNTKGNRILNPKPSKRSPWRWYGINGGAVLSEHMGTVFRCVIRMAGVGIHSALCLFE